MEQNTIIDLIEQQLQKGLPGKQAQYLMAPEKRLVDIESAESRALKKGAVLVPLFLKENEAYILLTQRAEYKGNHSGEISFPGGKFDAKYDCSLDDTVLREAYEEVGLEQDNICLLGQLSPLNIPVSQILVQPYLAFVKDISQKKIDNYEVVDTYSVPLSFFRKKEVLDYGYKSDFKYPFYNYKGKEIWGATAMMISELLCLMK